MADSKLLAPELSDSESMGDETVRFQELLLQASKELQQVQTDRPESTQIQPQPGFCIKTKTSEGKVFINICHSPSIPPLVDVTENELLQMLEEDKAGFRIPMSLGEPHAELDAKGHGCTAYDVAINSNFYLMMQKSDFLRELVVTIAREGLEDKYGLQLNLEWRMLKYRPFLGSIWQQNIRSRKRPRIQELGTLQGPERPHMNLWLEAPDLLLAEIDLPKLDGAGGLTLEIGENLLVMGSPQQLYHINASIPLRINPEASRAAFHHRRKQLMVSMPLLHISLKRPGILGRRKCSWKPWMVALTTTAVLLALAIIIGLLVYFLVYDQKTYYYQASFLIPSIKYSSDLSVEQSRLRTTLKEKLSNEIDVIFQRSSLKHHYVKSQVVNFRPSNDGLKVDMLIKFQFPLNNVDTLKRQADSILHKKLQSTEIFLKRDISLPYLREMNAAQAENILNSDCGLGMEYPQTARIADGKPADKASWPWQSSLQVDGVHLCGASLIGSQWLLTSAHCFDTYKNPKLWTVSFGTTLSRPLMTRKMASIIIHENYAAHKHDDDIAVVKLSSPVLFSENLRRVCLPDATFQVLPKSKVFVTGWGALRANGPFPNSLQEVEIEIISNDVCNQVNVYGGAISSGMICAGFLTGKLDACEGDSGGPLVISNDRNIWYLLGIVSWGIDCGKENKPGIYTRVTHYRNWIKSKTNI